MGTIIGIANEKGGVGKTTTCVNLVSEFASRGFEALGIDGEQQVNMTHYYFGNDSKMFEGARYKEEDFITWKDVIENEANPFNAIYTTHYTKRRKFLSSFKTIDFDVNILAGSKRLSEIEVDNVNALQSAKQSLIREYDIIFLDFPPTRTDLTPIYMAICDYIVIPIELGNDWALTGYYDFLDLVKIIQDSGVNEKLAILGSFFTKAMLYKKNQEENFVESQDQGIKEGMQLFDSFTHDEYATVMRALGSHEPLNIYKPSSRIAKDYSNLADEIINRLKERGELNGYNG